MLIFAIFFILNLCSTYCLYCIYIDYRVSVCAKLPAPVDISKYADEFQSLSYKCYEFLHELIDWILLKRNFYFHGIAIYLFQNSWNYSQSSSKMSMGICLSETNPKLSRAIKDQSKHNSCCCCFVYLIFGLQWISDTILLEAMFTNMIDLERSFPQEIVYQTKLGGIRSMSDYFNLVSTRISLVYQQHRTENIAGSSEFQVFQVN